MTTHAAPYDATRDVFAPDTVAPKHRAEVAPSALPAPLTAASHVNGYRGESVPLFTEGAGAWLGGAL